MEHKEPVRAGFRFVAAVLAVEAVEREREMLDVEDTAVCSAPVEGWRIDASMLVAEVSELECVTEVHEDSPVRAAPLAARWCLFAPTFFTES